ncbi:MAG: AAA family ATPase [Rhodobacteraceae bacterium]|nr:AAA family ATPase [Paracoccaceae bacterium]
MSITETKGQFNAAEHEAEAEALRQRIRAIMKGESTTQTALQKESEIPHGTFTNWFAGTYPGRVDNVNAKVLKWLDAREANKALALTIPSAPDFVDTPTSQRIAQVLQTAQVMPDMALIVGGAGVGKTMTLQRYKAENPYVTIITARPSSARANPLFSALGRALGVKDTSPAMLFDAVADMVKNHHHLIVIDEAQHLKMDALEELRGLHDQHGVGIVLMGNQDVHSRLTSGKFEADFAQLFSRIGLRLVLDKVGVADVRAILKAWKVDEADLTKTCRHIAGQPGALRVLSKTLRMAHMIAGAEGKPLCAKHIDDAYGYMSNGGSK